MEQKEAVTNDFISIGTHSAYHKHWLPTALPPHPPTLPSFPSYPYFSRNNVSSKLYPAPVTWELKNPTYLHSIQVVFVVIWRLCWLQYSYPVCPWLMYFSGSCHVSDNFVPRSHQGNLKSKLHSPLCTLYTGHYVKLSDFVMKFWSKWSMEFITPTWL